MNHVVSEATCEACGRSASVILKIDEHGHARNMCAQCVDLETADRGGPIEIVAAIVGVGLAVRVICAAFGGCAPPRPSGVSSPVWCEDCAVGGGR